MKTAVSLLPFLTLLALVCGCGKHSPRIVQVTAQYPGASPREVADTFAYPIEVKLRRLPQVDSITSISSGERLETYIVISHDGHPQEVLRRITAELDSGEIVLPPGAEVPAVELMPTTATVPAESPTEIDCLVVEPKREAIAEYGFTERDVASALQKHFAANVSATSPLEKLRAVRVAGPEKKEVPVTELAEFRVEKQPSHIVTHWPSK